MQTERLEFEAGNGDGGVAVPVMDPPAFATHPLPDLQTFAAFGAAQTSRAGLGRQTLVPPRSQPLRGRICTGACSAGSPSSRRERALPFPQAAFEAELREFTGSKITFICW